MSNSSVEVYSVGDNHLAAILVVTVSSIGLCSNLFIIVCFPRADTLWNPFGQLICWQAISDVIHCMIFTFYMGPMIFFNVGFMKAFSRYCGIILMACFESTLYCHLLISVNRFCAIYFPLHNSKVLTPRVTTCLIIVALVIIFLQLLFYYILGGCAFVYVDDYWHFTLISTPTCINGVPWVSSLEKLLSLVFLVLAIDFITLSRVHIYNRQKVSRRAAWSAMLKASEVKFLKQACILATLFGIGEVMYFVLPLHLTNTWTKFCATTLAWATIHSADGIITILFIREFHDLLFGCFRKEPTTIRISVLVTSPSHQT